MSFDRKSYASVEEKIHPNAKKFLGTNTTFTNSVTPQTKQIVDEILKFVERNNLIIDTGTGEWDWLEKNKKNDYLQTLRQWNCDILCRLYSNMFRNDVTYGYLSPSYNDIISEDRHLGVISNILCNVDTCFEFTDLKNLKSLVTRKEIGTPYGIEEDGGFILPDTPRHYYYSYKINGILKNIKRPTVLEIGGGYGGVAFLLNCSNDTNYTYLDIDLTPGLLATYYFLKLSGAKVNFASEPTDIAEGQINLIPFEKFTNFGEVDLGIDLIFNFRSLCEMSKETIEDYFNFINKSDANFIFHENSNFLLFPNSIRHIEVLGSEFPIDRRKYKIESMSITPFTGGNGRYREFFYKLA